ncbi:uncharacterized protein LOC112848074 [Oreochromis niloticus]|uniref:uncharacterized protein LOC112848074 n=1 Tax=Oreochromis niloticus TaxID=8128 RepID=UPI000DF4C9EE|nr:uncharacterized protein LOC112848074 [Oreochromis niloticus]
MRGGGIPRAARTVVSDEIRATIIDHVINHGLSLREAGERVQPNLRRSTVASIIRIFQQTNRVWMKQLYTVPFERNSERVKELRRQYVQRVMELEANQAPHEFIYIDEAGFNLAKRRRRGRNVIGKRATVDVPGQRGASITMCAAIANAGLLLHRCQVGPYNTERLLAFLNDLHQRLVPEQGQEGENMRTFVITWDNVAFHHSQAITTWFEVHPRLVSLFLPPYSPFLNPIEEFFSAWRWKVYDHQPHDQMSLLEAMDAGSRDITVDDCQGWIRHTRRFYPRCIDLDNIRCDVDENMWPNPEDRRD